MLNKVIDIVVELIVDQDKTIDRSELGLDTNLRDLGLTSFDMATLTVMIEDEYDVDIFEDGIVLTIEEIVKILEDNK